MRELIIKGTTIVFAVGVIIGIFYFVIDIISRMWRPLILWIFDNEAYVIPMTIVFTVALILIVGFFATRVKLRKFLKKFNIGVPILNWFFKGSRKAHEGITEEQGALVQFHDGTYYIAAIAGKREIVRASGQSEEMYILYSPSAPVPWSGMPIIFAKKENVIPLNISFASVYSITTSLGRNVPDVVKQYIPPKGEEAAL